MIRSKKGTVTELFFGVGVFFVFSIAIIFGLVLLDNFNERIQANDHFSAGEKADLQADTDEYPVLWDNLFISFVILLTLAVVVGAALLDTNPAVFVVSLILLMLLVVPAAILSNVYQAATENAQITAYASSFPKTNLAMEFLPQYFAAMAVLVLVVLFAKRRVTGGVGI